ncbi:MAG: hypothetical protein WCT25_04410 [Candidatus Paceibacterota bacterium]
MNIEMIKPVAVTVMCIMVMVAIIRGWADVVSGKDNLWWRRPLATTVCLLSAGTLFIVSRWLAGYVAVNCQTSADWTVSFAVPLVALVAAMCFGTAVGLVGFAIKTLLGSGDDVRMVCGLAYEGIS